MVLAGHFYLTHTSLNTNKPTWLLIKSVKLYIYYIINKSLHFFNYYETYSNYKLVYIHVSYYQKEVIV